MPAQTPIYPDSSDPAAPSSRGSHLAARPSTAEVVQRWHCDGGVEGATLEWMLDRMRPPQEARR